MKVVWGARGAVGWELGQTRTHDEVNQVDGITGGSWIVPAYDAAGNMTAGPKPGAETTKHCYQYDAWNRLRRVFVDGDSDGVWDDEQTDTLIAEYRYDALNRRIAKIKPDPEHEGKYIRTDYYYTPRGQVVEERYADNLDDKETLATARKYQYVWDIRYIHAAVLRDADTDGDGDVLDEGGSERLYYTQDANFNVTALVETDGDVIERYVYDPYGKRTIYDDDWSDEITWANSKKNEILFTGHRLDPESGLYITLYRPYHPTLGRWLIADGVEPQYVDGPNLYSYVRCGPADGLDPDGERWIESATSVEEQKDSVDKMYERDYPNGPPQKADAKAAAKKAVASAGNPIQSMIDKIMNDAEKRRGNGPLGDSAQHCWAACYISARFGFAEGEMAAYLEDFAEMWQGMKGDAPSDIIAQHFGARCPVVNLLLFAIFPAKMCDCCCQTYTKERGEQ